MSILALIVLLAAATPDAAKRRAHEVEQALLYLKMQLAHGQRKVAEHLVADLDL